MIQKLLENLFNLSIDNLENIAKNAWENITDVYFLRHNSSCNYLSVKYNYN